MPCMVGAGGSCAPCEHTHRHKEVEEGGERQRRTQSSRRACENVWMNVYAMCACRTIKKSSRGHTKITHTHTHTPTTRKQNENEKERIKNKKTPKKQKQQTNKNTSLCL